MIHNSLFLIQNLALTLPGGEKINPPNVPNVSISPIIQTGVTLLFVFAIILSLFFLVLGGIRWIISEGDKQKLASARSQLTYAVIGLLVVLLSFFIVNVIGGVFGINLLNTPIPPLLEPCLPGRPC